jgi:hypothetical protein
MKWMDMGPYASACHLVLTHSRRDWNALCKEQGIIGHQFIDEPSTLWLPGFTLIVVCLPLRGMPRELAIGYCIHEAVHCWQNIHDHINAGRVGREVEAYSIQWIAGWLIKEMKL